jgi:hypothetical protein
MAIDPLQRRMFNKIPGVNPAQVAASIYPAPLPIKPVAGQPLSIRDLVTQARLVLNDPNADPDQVANLTTQLKNKGLPPEALKVAAKPLITEGIGEEIDPVITGKKAVSSWYKPFVAEEAAGYTGPVEKEFVPPEPGDMRYHEPEARDIGTLTEAATAAVQETVKTGEVSAKEADVAKDQGQATLAAVLDAEESLDAQIATMTTGGALEGATSKNYNELAKELLGLDKSEADIPEWAAPIFLFGLNLMKAPVSTATRDTGLGGLLADIGKAGEVGFASFGKERARKRKERAAIGQIALKLKTADDATKIASYKATLESKKFWLTHSLNVRKEARLTGTAAQTKLDQDSTFMATQFDRVMKQFTNDQDIDGRSAWTQEFHDAINKIAAAPNIDLMKDVYRNPVRLNLVGKIAAGEAGLRPDFKKDTIPFGPGKELTFDVNALKRYAKKNRISYGKALNEITQDPNNTKYAGIALPTNFGKDQFQVIPEKKGGITTPTYVDTAKQNTEIAAAQTANRPVDASKFTSYGPSYLTDAPTMKRLELGNVSGVSKFMYVDFGQLAFENAKRRKAEPPKDPLTIQEIGKEPTKYPTIVSAVHRDTSGALDNISNIEISTGADTTQDFLLNRNALDRWRVEIAAKVNQERIKNTRTPGVEVKLIKPEDVIAGRVPYEILEEFGVLTPLHAERVHTKPVTVTEFDLKRGQFTTRTGKPGDIVGLTTQASRDKIMATADSTAVSNSQAHRIRNLFKDVKGPMSMTSAFTDLKASAIGALRLAGVGPKVSLANLNNFIEGGGPDAEGRTGAAKMAATREMVKNWSTRFDAWGKIAIKDGAARQRLKSLFIDMAFNMASTREGGKLTDNDVNWAFKTLGFDADAYFQSPEIVMAGLDEAVQTINFKMDQKLASIIPDAQRDEIDKWNANPANKDNERSALEDHLRQRMRGVSAGEGRIRSQVIGVNGSPLLNEKGIPVYTYRYDRRKGWRQAGPVGTRQVPTGDGQAPTSTIDYGGISIPLKGVPSTETSAVINMLQQANVPRTVAGLSKYLEGLSVDEQARIKSQLHKLNELGFFGK